MTVQNHNKATQVGLLLSYYIVLSFWAAQTLSMSMLSRNVAGQTKKSVVIAANFIAWATGNAIGTINPLPHPTLHETNIKNLGPQVFLSWNAPRYLIAFAVHMGCYVVLVFVIVFLRWYLKSQNLKRDKLQAELAASGTAGVVDEKMVHAFDDLTDVENVNFRYVY
jgi:hypothetical protein